MRNKSTDVGYSGSRNTTFDTEMVSPRLIWFIEMRNSSSVTSATTMADKIFFLRVLAIWFSAFPSIFHRRLPQIPSSYSQMFSCKLNEKSDWTLCGTLLRLPFDQPAWLLPERTCAFIEWRRYRNYRFLWWPTAERRLAWWNACDGALVKNTHATRNCSERRTTVGSVELENKQTTSACNKSR